MTKQQIHALRAAALETTLALMRTGWKVQQPKEIA